MRTKSPENNIWCSTFKAAMKEIEATAIGKEYFPKPHKEFYGQKHREKHVTTINNPRI